MSSDARRGPAHTGITPVERVTEAAQRITPDLVAELPAELLTRAASALRHAADVLHRERDRQPVTTTKGDDRG